MYTWSFFMPDSHESWVRHHVVKLTYLFVGQLKQRWWGLVYEVWIDATSRPALMPDARRKKMGSLGPAGIGIVIKKDNKIIHEVNRYIGIYDNNAAEYMGFIEAMLLLIDMNVGEAIVYTDSMLLQRQMKGEVNCTSEKLIDLYAEAMRISQFIPSLIIKWIPRGENTQADKLADAVFKDWDKIIK